MLVAPHEGEGRSQVVQRDVNNDDADTTTAARREATHLIKPSTLPAASTTGAPEMRSVTSSWRHKGARWIPRRRPRVSYPATSVTSPNPLEMTATHLEDVKHGGVGGHGDGRRLHGISYPFARDSTPAGVDDCWVAPPLLAATQRLGHRAWAAPWRGGAASVALWWRQLSHPVGAGAALCVAPCGSARKDAMRGGRHNRCLKACKSALTRGRLVLLPRVRRVLLIHFIS